jgi:hypothetical protein
MIPKSPPEALTSIPLLFRRRLRYAPHEFRAYGVPARAGMISSSQDLPVRAPPAATSRPWSFTRFYHVSTPIHSNLLNQFNMPNDTSSALTEALDDGYQLTDKDELQLALKDEDYKLATWEELKAIIGSINQLVLLHT